MSILDSALDMVNRDIDHEDEEPDKDVWQTYPQSIDNGGDCEDKCLAMRQVLLDKGVPDYAMSLVGGRLMRGRSRGENHMVLKVLYCAQLFILDPMLRNPIDCSRYMKKRMAPFAELTINGLFFYRNRTIGKFPVCTRDEDPRWAGYQNQLKIERGEG